MSLLMDALNKAQDEKRQREGGGVSSQLPTKSSRVEERAVDHESHHNRLPLQGQDPLTPGVVYEDPDGSDEHVANSPGIKRDMLMEASTPSRGRRELRDRSDVEHVPNNYTPSQSDTYRDREDFVGIGTPTEAHNLFAVKGVNRGREAYTKGVLGGSLIVGGVLVGMLGGLYIWYDMSDGSFDLFKEDALERFKDEHVTVADTAGALASVMATTIKQSSLNAESRGTVAHVQSPQVVKAMPPGASEESVAPLKIEPGGFVRDAGERNQDFRLNKEGILVRVEPSSKGANVQVEPNVQQADTATQRNITPQKSASTGLTAEFDRPDAILIAGNRGGRQVVNAEIPSAESTSKGAARSFGSVAEEDDGWSFERVNDTRRASGKHITENATVRTGTERTKSTDKIGTKPTIAVVDGRRHAVFGSPKSVADSAEAAIRPDPVKKVTVGEQRGSTTKVASQTVIGQPGLAMTQHMGSYKEGSTASGLDTEAIPALDSSPLGEGAGQSKQNSSAGVTTPVPAFAAPSASESVADSTAKGIRIQRRPLHEILSRKNNEAYAFFSEGEISRAKVIYKEILEMDPRERGARLGLAAVAVRERRLRDAERLYRGILNDHPNDSMAHAGLLSLKKSADPALREKSLQILIRQNPNAPQLHFVLGSLYIRQRNWQSASDVLMKAHQLDPSNGDVAYNLAISLDQIKRPGEALIHYKKALSIGEGSGRVAYDLQQIRTRIRELGGQ
ncbi:MAG: tetratricopeptide repeat protein [Magnetococcales bacterium]|nr:tetratricopeptide repeat protein [Magnetococcales bacterium]